MRPAQAETLSSEQVSLIKGWMAKERRHARFLAQQLEISDSLIGRMLKGERTASAEHRELLEQAMALEPGTLAAQATNWEVGR